MTILVTLFDRKFQVFKKSQKWTILAISNELLSTQNVIVVCFDATFWTIFKQCELYHTFKKFENRPAGLAKVGEGDALRIYVIYLLFLLRAVKNDVPRLMKLPPVLLLLVLLSKV